MLGRSVIDHINVSIYYCWFGAAFAQHEWQYLLHWQILFLENRKTKWWLWLWLKVCLLLRRLALIEALADLMQIMHANIWKAVTECVWGVNDRNEPLIKSHSNRTFGTAFLININLFIEFCLEICSSQPLRHYSPLIHNIFTNKQKNNA